MQFSSITPKITESGELLSPLEKRALAILDPEIIFLALEKYSSLKQAIVYAEEEVLKLAPKGSQDLNKLLATAANQFIEYTISQDFSADSLLLLRAFLESDLCQELAVHNSLNLNKLSKAYLRHGDFQDYSLIADFTFFDQSQRGTFIPTLNRELTTLNSKPNPGLKAEVILNTGYNFKEFHRKINEKQSAKVLCNGILAIGGQNENLFESLLYFLAFDQAKQIRSRDFQRLFDSHFAKHSEHSDWAKISEMAPLLYFSRGTLQESLNSYVHSDFLQTLTNMEYIKPEVNYHLRQVFRLAAEMFSYDKTIAVEIINRLAESTWRQRVFEPILLSNLITALEQFPPSTAQEFISGKLFKRDYSKRIAIWIGKNQGKPELKTVSSQLIRLYQRGLGHEIRPNDIVLPINTRIPLEAFASEKSRIDKRTNYLRAANSSLNDGIFSQRFMELISYHAIVKLPRLPTQYPGKASDLGYALRAIEYKSSLLERTNDLGNKLAVISALFDLLPEIADLGISNTLLYRKAWKYSKSLLESTGA